MKETQKKPKEKQLLDRDTVSRSNVLIESKSSTSLFERKLLNIAIAKAYVEDGELIAKAVSYTHLTLPTIYSVWISVGAVSLKKKKKERRLA